MIPSNHTTHEAPFKASSTLFRDGWTLHRAGQLASTNSAAARLPEWHAVRSDIQTSGRGRTGRRWVSNQGGLWLSAVLPCPATAAPWSLLPLAAGWSVIEALEELGAPGLRLRWPNDIMSGQRKLAGLLVERYNAQTAVIGIGLNVTNSPEASDNSLFGLTARLVDLVPAGCDLDAIAPVILRSIRRAHTLLLNGEFPLIARKLNEHWSNPRLVAITLNDHAHPFTGLFTGIDDSGRLRLSTDYSSACFYEAAQVSLMRELE
jgi:BirA family biotin operon repressor/biotin-[acetyl-CoA-carboxylase] ligase